MWFTCRVSERKVAPPESGYADTFDDIPRAAHHDSRDVVFFQVTGDQTDRLVAHGAVGNEQSHVGLKRTRVFQSVARVLVESDSLAAVGWYADEFGRKVGDYAFMLCSAQRGYR